MAVSNQQELQHVIKREDVARWITFSGFWGFVFYLLSLVGLLASHRRQPLRINANTALVGMGIHVGSFITVGSLLSALQSLWRGKSTTQQAREQIGSGDLERSMLQQVAGAAAGSVVPFAWTVGSLRVAERITGKRTFTDSSTINWLGAAGTTALLSGVTSLAVNRIAAWVARDAASSQR